MPERKLEYENLKHKADAGFLLKAPSLERLYIDSALAMIDQLVTLDRVKDTEKRTLNVKGTSKETLMVAWLNEILAFFTAEKFLPKRITFQKFDGKEIQATFFGDKYDPLRHGSPALFKPVSPNQVQLGELHDQDLHFFAKVSFSSC